MQSNPTISLTFQKNHVEITHLNQPRYASQQIDLEYPFLLKHNENLILSQINPSKKPALTKIILGCELLIFQSHTLPPQLKESERKAAIKQFTTQRGYFIYHTLSSTQNQTLIISLSIRENNIIHLLKLCKQCRLKIITMEAEPLALLAAIPTENTATLLHLHHPQKELLCLCKDGKIQHWQQQNQKSLFDLCKLYKSTHPEISELWSNAIGDTWKNEEKKLLTIEIKIRRLYNNKQTIMALAA